MKSIHYSTHVQVDISVFVRKIRIFLLSVYWYLCVQTFGRVQDLGILGKGRLKKRITAIVAVCPNLNVIFVRLYI